MSGRKTVAIVLHLILMARMPSAVASVGPSTMAETVGQTCRVFLPTELIRGAQALKHEGQHIEALDAGRPMIDQLSQDFDMAVSMNWQHHWIVSMALPQNGVVEVSWLRDDLIRNLPDCRQREQLATLGYFRGVLAARARARLDQYYMSRRTPVGLGELILESEFLLYNGYGRYQSEFDGVLKQYKTLVEQTKRTWSNSRNQPFFQRVDAIRHFIYPFYKNYFSENASLSRMLMTDSGGNCEANTKLITAILVDSEIDFGPNWNLVVQLFQDHMQPLLMESKTGRLVNLVSGEDELKPGTVYSPAVMDYGIANLGGRAVTSEREFGVKLKGIYVWQMDFVLGLQNFIPLPGGSPESAGDSPAIWQMGRQSSYYQKGLIPPLHAEIDFGPTGGSPRADAYFNRHSAKLKPGAHGEDYENPDCLVNGKPITPDELAQINAAVWAQYPEADKPSLEKQHVLTCSRLPAKAQSVIPNLTFPILQYPLLIVAGPNEALKLRLDYPFFFLPCTSKSLVKTFNVNGFPLEVRPQTHNVVFPSQTSLEQITGAEIDPRYWKSKPKDLAEQVLNAKSALVDVNKLTQTFKSPEVLFREPVPGLTDGIDEFVTAMQFARTMQDVLNIEPNSDPTVSSYCELRKYLSSYTENLKQNPKAALDNIDQQDIVGQLRFFKSFAALSELLDAIVDHLPCEPPSSDTAIEAKYPLRPIFNYVVTQSLNGAKVKMAIRPPRIVSEILVRPTFDPAATVASPRKGLPEPDRDGVEQKFAQNVPDELSANKELFVIRAESVLGLLMNAPLDDMRNPVVQALTSVTWSEGLQHHYNAAWADWAGAPERLSQVWHWAPFLRNATWMRGWALADAFAVGLQRPGHDYGETRDGQDLFVVRVPEWLETDLRQAWQEHPPIGTPLHILKGQVGEIAVTEVPAKFFDLNGTCVRHSSDFSSSADSDMQKIADRGTVEKTTVTVSWYTRVPCSGDSSSWAADTNLGEQVTVIETDELAQTVHIEDLYMDYATGVINKFDLAIPARNLKAWIQHNQ